MCTVTSPLVSDMLEKKMGQFSGRWAIHRVPSPQKYHVVSDMLEKSPFQSGGLRIQDASKTYTLPHLLSHILEKMGQVSDR